ncbi:MAG: P-loop NTPase [Actinomycetota bacterium]|nr:P-loop NTPase [Actinomycetota bacterium]
MSKIPVAIIDSEVNSIDKAKYLLEKFPDLEVTRTGTDLGDLEALLAERKPCLILVGPVYKLSDIEHLLVSYRSSLYFAKIILLVRGMSAEMLKKALKLNIHDVLEIPFSYSDLKEAIDRAGKSLLKEDTDIGRSKAVHRRITVFGTKGGVGKSFISVNLAIGLINRARKKVSIFDTNYQFGDIALMLSLNPKYSVYDILPVINELDPKVLHDFLTTHSSGLRVLPAPLDLSKGTGINSKVTMKILENLSQISDYTVVDTASYFSDNILDILRDTDYLCIVTSKDTPSIKNLKIALQMLEQLKFPRENIYVILNRADSKVGITLEEIEQTIQRKVDVAIPSDRIVPISVNKGVPVILDSPRSAVARSIQKLVKIISDSKRR